MASPNEEDASAAMPHGPDPHAASSSEPHEYNPWASLLEPGSRVDCALHAFVCSCRVIARCNRRARLGDAHSACSAAMEEPAGSNGTPNGVDVR